MDWSIMQVLPTKDAAFCWSTRGLKHLLNGMIDKLSNGAVC